MDITDRVEASNALKRSEARYRALVEAITQAVWSWSPHTAEGDYARNLQWWEKITGQTPQEQRDDPHRWLSVVHPDDRARAAAVWTEARQSGNCYDVEYRVKSPFGDYRHIHARGVAIFGSQGTVEEWVGTLDDITEQRHAQQQLHDNEERLRAAFSAARMVGWTYDPHTNRMNRSENVQELFGYVPEPTPEAGWASIVPEDLEQHKQTVRTALAQDLGYKSQYRVLRPDTGELRWFEDHARGERDASGRLIRVAGVIIDITDRKRAEEALRASEESLRDANRRKDDFLAMLAHELRNPLAPIRTSLHILGLSGCDATTVDNVRTMVERQVQHLARIVDDLLDVSRITRGKITLRKSRVDLARFVRVSADDHRRAFDARKVQLFLSMPPQPVWVSADSTRLAQILDNLLTNALKFTNEGGKVEVKATVDEVANLAFLSVRDSGVGIELEVLPHLFGAFTQADQSLDRSQGGLGLGLAIVKGLVEMHGGAVRAESPGVGQGATFTISLRLDRESPLLVDGPVAKLCSIQRLRILVVEDNRDTAESLRLLLELSGYQVTIAHSGVEGVEAARRTQPEVVLCDLGLPGMDGFAVARALRGQSERLPAKLIAVTGYGREEDRVRAIEAGFDLHLTKPVDPQKLLAELVKM